MGKPNYASVVLGSMPASAPTCRPIIQARLHPEGLLDHLSDSGMPMSDQLAMSLDEPLESRPPHSTRPRGQRFEIANVTSSKLASDGASLLAGALPIALVLTQEANLQALAAEKPFAAGEQISADAATPRACKEPASTSEACLDGHKGNALIDGLALRRAWQAQFKQQLDVIIKGGNVDVSRLRSACGPPSNW